jgi:hypothetical protein
MTTPIRAAELKPQHMSAKRSAEVVIFTVDIVRNRPADRNVLRPRNYGRKPSSRHGKREDLIQGGASLTSEDALFPIPGDESI